MCSSSISALLLQEGGVPRRGEVVGMNVLSYLLSVCSMQHAGVPTTSPCGYSSFLKEESRDSTATHIKIVPFYTSRQSFYSIPNKKEYNQIKRNHAFGAGALFLKDSFRG